MNEPVKLNYDVGRKRAFGLLWFSIKTIILGHGTLQSSLDDESLFDVLNKSPLEIHLRND